MNLLTPPARRRWLFAALAAGLLAALAIAFALGQRNPNPAADAQAAAPDAAPGGPAIAAQVPPAEPPAAFDDSVIPAPGIAPISAHLVPLPPADAPLAEIFDELLDRLQRGDARAGCRLYREMRRCWNYASMAVNQELFMAMASKEDASDLEMNIAVNVLASAKESESVCAGIERDKLEAHYFDTVRRTAGLGDPLAMVEFAETGGFLEMEYARNPERLVLWHRLAPEMIERALRMGTPEAAFALHMARSHEVGLLGALLPDDPVEAHAMSLLLSRVLTANWNPPPPRTSPQQAREAEQRADVLHRQYFADRNTPAALRLWSDPLQPRIEDCERAD